MIFMLLRTCCVKKLCELRNNGTAVSVATERLA
jgi:hypothetical protein